MIRNILMTFVLSSILTGAFIGLSLLYYEAYKEDKNKPTRIIWSSLLTLSIMYFVVIQVSLCYHTVAEEEYKNAIKAYNNALIKEQRIIEKYKKLSQKGMIDNYIDKLCKELKLDSKLVKSLIFVESGYNVNAKGKHGEIGLMQIKLTTAQIFNPNLTKQDLYDWHKNIYYGCLYLRAQIQQYGFKKGILSYNGGGGILRYKINNRYINENYYKRIMSIYKTM